MTSSIKFYNYTDTPILFARQDNTTYVYAVNGYGVLSNITGDTYFTYAPSDGIVAIGPVVTVNLTLLNAFSPNVTSHFIVYKSGDTNLNYCTSTVCAILAPNPPYNTVVVSPTTSASALADSPFTNISYNTYITSPDLSTPSGGGDDPGTPSSSGKYWILLLIIISVIFIVALGALKYYEHTHPMSLSK